jgi:hypothetical protein
MERARSIIPVKRIEDDISDWPRVNKKIIDVQGGMVEGEVLSGPASADARWDYCEDGPIIYEG